MNTTRVLLCLITLLAVQVHTGFAAAQESIDIEEEWSTVLRRSPGHLLPNIQLFHDCIERAIGGKGLSEEEWVATLTIFERSELLHRRLMLDLPCSIPLENSFLFSTALAGVIITQQDPSIIERLVKGGTDGKNLGRVNEIIAAT